MRAGLVRASHEHAWSGDRAYRDLVRLPWLTTHVTREMLTHVSRAGPVSYGDWVSQADDPVVARLFEHGHRDEPRAAGDDAFIDALAERVESPRRRMGLEEIIVQVVRSRRVDDVGVLALAPSPACAGQGLDCMEGHAQRCGDADRGGSMFGA